GAPPALHRAAEQQLLPLRVEVDLPGEVGEAEAIDVPADPRDRRDERDPPALVIRDEARERAAIASVETDAELRKHAFEDMRVAARRRALAQGLQEAGDVALAQRRGPEPARARDEPIQRGGVTRRVRAQLERVRGVERR